MEQIEELKSQCVAMMQQINKFKEDKKAFNKSHNEMIKQKTYELNELLYQIQELENPTGTK